VPKARERGTFDLGAGPGSRVRLRDGVQMPVLGLGVWKTPSGRATRDSVDAALRAGYRLIDTAALYGNEADVGQAVRDSGLPREDVFVTTKLWNDDQGYERALVAFEKSQAALGLGGVDLYLIHWPMEPRLESWRALTKLQREGACRSIGVSNFTVPHLEELREASDVVPSVNQVEFNPFLFQRELLEYCRKHSIQLEAYAPLTRGRRLDDATVRVVAEAHHKTPAQVVLRWGLQHDVVVIPKSVRPERIVENGQLFDFELREDEMNALDRLNENLRTAWDPSKVP
jgi:methylglyoxal/glyoxal reductase